MKLTLKEAVVRFIAMLCAVLVFTFFDWMVHSSVEALAVPSYYFTNKIIYGTLWAFLASLAFRNVELKKQAGLITLITVGLLQIRYVLWGYPLLFHLIVLPEHLFFLYFSTYFALKAIR